jgi:hypothetical protein
MEHHGEIYETNQEPQNPFEYDDDIYARLRESDDEQDICSIGGGVWIGDEKTGTTEKQDKQQTYTGFDPEGYGHNRTADIPIPPKRPNKFAKVRVGLRVSRFQSLHMMLTQVQGMGAPRNVPRIPEYQGKFLPPEHSHEGDESGYKGGDSD